MKKILTALLSIALISICFTGCNRTAPPIEQSEDIKPSIVATIFPAYDFAKQVCGDNGNVTMLLPPGTGSHSYKPSPKDIIRTQNSDLPIYKKNSLAYMLKLNKKMGPESESINFISKE